MHARARSFSLWVTVALLASGLATLPATPAAADDDTVWCSVDASPPCIVSAKVNGTPVSEVVCAEQATYQLQDGGGVLTYRAQHDDDASM